MHTTNAKNATCPPRHGIMREKKTYVLKHARVYTADDSPRNTTFNCIGIFAFKSHQLERGWDIGLTKLITTH